jgi:mycothiol synthase
MSSSLPEGFTLRRATPDDMATAGAVLAAEETALRGSSNWGADELRDWWGLVDPGGGWIVERDAQPVAFGVLFRREDLFNLWVSVHPDATGRGIATALLERGEARARECGATTLYGGAFAENEPGRRLLARLGYREARHYFHMEIDLGETPPPPEWPPGFTVSSFRPGDERAMYDTLNEAFVDEWNWRPAPFDEWVQMRLGAEDFDPDVWWLVRAEDEVAAVLRGDAKKFGGGFIGALGVRAAYRRKGIGLALLRHAFLEFRRRGEPKVGLGVDAENPTGATRLYERAGMHVTGEEVAYVKELS